MARASAARMRVRWASLAALSVSLGFSLGCKTAPPKTPSITDGDRGVVLDNLEAAMHHAGHHCEGNAKSLLCDKGKVPFVLMTIDQPYRAVVVAFAAQMKVPCEDVQPRLNKVNNDIDVVKVFCNEKGTLLAMGMMPIPEAGLTAKDVNAFVDQWLRTFITVANGYALVEVMK